MNATVSLRNSNSDELEVFARAEKEEENALFVIPYSLNKHLKEFSKAEVRYKTIYDTRDGRLLGYIILRLEEDAESVEFRRIVVFEKDKGIGDDRRERRARRPMARNQNRVEGDVDQRSYPPDVHCEPCAA